jgi:hypothetical protein
MSNRYDIWMNDHFLSIQEESDYDFFHPRTERLQKHGANENPGWWWGCNVWADSQSERPDSLTRAMAAYNNRNTAEMWNQRSG